METVLPEIPILAGMSEPAKRLLTSKARSRRAAPGEFIVREGETGNQMFIILSGAVRVVKAAGLEKELQLARLTAGDFFGEGCILNPLTRAASVVATKETQLCSLSSMAFYDLYHADPAQYGILVLNLARDLSRRLHRLDEVFAACF